jgi:hypothetical protein
VSVRLIFGEFFLHRTLLFDVFSSPDRLGKDRSRFEEAYPECKVSCTALLKAIRRDGRVGGQVKPPRNRVSRKVKAAAADSDRDVDMSSNASDDHLDEAGSDIEIGSGSDFESDDSEPESS